MSIEENKTTVQRTFEDLFNHGRLTVADEVASAAFVTHATPESPRGPDGLRHLVIGLRAAFPDLRIVIEELIAEGEMVVACTTFHGTQCGPFLGIAPTGRHVVQEQMHLLRFAAGKVVEHRTVRDDVSLLRHLGVLPQPTGEQY